MKIYITRHGQTERNAQNRVLGRSDIPLDELGLSQAEKLGEELKDVKLDAIYVSPMIRTRQTAEAAAKYQECEIIPDEALIEQNFGIYEGWPRDNEEYQFEKHQYFKPFPEGESFLDVSARVYPFIEKVKEEWKDKPDANILLVTHGGICRMIHNYFEGMDNDTFAGYFMGNCELKEFDVE